MPLITLTFVMTFTTKGYDIEPYEAVCYHVTKKILVTMIVLEIALCFL